MTFYDWNNTVAFLLRYDWDPKRPDHGDDAALSGLWAVVQLGPAFTWPDIGWITYTRGEPLPFETGGQRYQAMEAVT